jgi:hypothetical protein
MLYDNEMQGHDAHLEEVLIDVLRRTVRLRMSAYPASQAPSRVPIELVFDRVEAVHTLANLKELEGHHFAGHMSYWKVEKGAGTSYFYLAAGCLSITAATAPILNHR